MCLPGCAWSSRNSVWCFPEEELCVLCDCTFLSTDAFQAVEAARYCGFSGITKQTLTIDEVETIVRDGLFPIIYLDLAPIDGIHQPDAFVILSVTPFGVVALDPAKGERVIPRDVFSAAWKMRHNLANIVRP